MEVVSLIQQIPSPSVLYDKILRVILITSHVRYHTESYCPLVPKGLGAPRALCQWVLVVMVVVVVVELVCVVFAGFNFKFGTLHSSLSKGDRAGTCSQKPGINAASIHSTICLLSHAYAAAAKD